jgi:Zn-dependent metalloprotease
MHDQSGALDEAISDVFAAFIAHHDGRGHEWRIGESVGQPVRDAADPHRSANPASMSEYVMTADDNGGVHANSTIASHAAYLMTAGSQGLGWEQAAHVWYRALERYLTSRAQFVDAADATAAAARDLGLSDSVVHDAWVAVGVLNE